MYWQRPTSLLVQDWALARRDVLHLQRQVQRHLEWLRQVWGTLQHV